MFSMFLKLIALSFSLLFIGYVIPGIKITSFSSAIVASIVIVIINLFIKPVLMALTLPINILTLGISILFINALLFLFVAHIVPGVRIENFLSAFLGAILLSIFAVGISQL